jgi:hypothetical protein
MKTCKKIPSSSYKCTLFVFMNMVHIDNLNRTVAGQVNTYYPLTYNKNSVRICKRYK